MKCAHQEEEAAYETEDHTGTKQIWTEAVSTCDLKQRLNNRPRLEQANSSVQSVHISPTWNKIVSKPGLFSFLHPPIARSGIQGSIEISFSHWSHTFSINQLMGNDALPSSHTV